MAFRTPQKAGARSRNRHNPRPEAYHKGTPILLAKSGWAGRAGYVAGIGTRSAAEARHVAQAHPDPARARGDGARRPGRLPQGQPAPQAARRARRRLRRRGLRRPLPRARPARAAAVAAGAGHPAAVPRGPARPAGRRGGARPDRLEVPARPRARRSRLRPSVLCEFRARLLEGGAEERLLRQAAGGAARRAACSRRAAGSAPTPPTCWRPSARSTGSSWSARPCARP